MPHDKNGNELKKGDRVTFDAIVHEIWTGENDCNALFEIVDEGGATAGFWHADNPRVTTNTRYAEKVPALPEVNS